MIPVKQRTKEEINKVNEPSFWKERLENAIKKRALSEAVYECGESKFNQIWELHRAIISLKVARDEKVLDVGCGYGRICGEFVPDNYVGIDLSPDFVNLAKEKYPDYKFEVQDVRKLPYKDKEFDWAILVSFKHMIKHYLGDDAWTPMEEEIKRVAKKVLVLEYIFPEQFEIL